MRARASSSRTKLRTALKALLGVLIVTVLLWRVNLQAIGLALASYSWPWLLAALLVISASWPVAAARWALLIRKVQFLHILDLTMIGQFYSIVFPGQVAGEFVKAYRLGKGNIDAERLAATVLLDRILGLIALLLVASVGLLLSKQRVPDTISFVFAGLTVVLICSLLALRLGAVHKLAISMIARLQHTRLREYALSVRRAVDAWRGFTEIPLRLAASFFLGVLFQMLGVAMLAILAANLGILLALADWAWIAGVVSLAVLLPVSVGGIGLREGALVGCLGFLGVAPERALALSFGVFALTLVGALTGGMLEMIEVVRKRPSSMVQR